MVFYDNDPNHSVRHVYYLAHKCLWSLLTPRTSTNLDTFKIMSKFSYKKHYSIDNWLRNHRCIGTNMTTYIMLRSLRPARARDGRVTSELSNKILQKKTFKCMFGTNCCDWRVLTQQIWLINRGQKNIWKQNDSQISWNALEMCMTT